MSYINDALNRAQREKDGHYERYGALISADPQGSGGRWRRRAPFTTAGVAFLLLIVAGLLAVFLVLRPTLLPKGAAPPAAQTSATETLPPTEATQGAGVTIGEAPAIREAERQFRKALEAQRRGQRKAAEALYRKVLILAPDHVQALNNLGVLYMGERRRAQAIALFSKAVVLKKDYVDPYYNLACLYAQQREIDESLWYLKIAVAIDGEAVEWAAKDPDLKKVVAMPAFKTLMEGQKN